MSDYFKDLAYTDHVRQVQAERLSPAARYMTSAEPAPDGLGPHEADFISARDNFFMATVSETGWPYVQHRGGAAGFVHVLDEFTLAYADVRGNRQYISTGNLRTNDRVALIFVDYAAAGRLKLLGRARTVAVSEDPALAARLTEGGRVATGPVEHLTVVTVLGHNWNCPKNITKRFTNVEIATAIAPLTHRLDALEAENQAMRDRLGITRPTIGK